MGKKVLKKTQKPDEVIHNFFEKSKKVDEVIQHSFYDEEFDRFFQFFLGLVEVTKIKQPVLTQKEITAETLSVIVLDKIYYSLLSDKCKFIHDKSIEVVDKNELDDHYKKHEDRDIIVMFFRLLKAGTNLYYDIDTIEKFRKEDFPLLQTLCNPLQIQVINYILDYIHFYSKNRRLPSDTILDDICESNYKEHPYLYAVYFNTKLQIFDEHKKLHKPCPEDVDRLKKFTSDKRFTKFNVGYYYLLLARYYSFVDVDFLMAKDVLNEALKCTLRYCPYNGRRIEDIRRLNISITKNISWTEQLSSVRRLEEKLAMTRKEFMNFMGIAVAVISIPLSIISISNRSYPDIQTIKQSMMLGGYVVFSILMMVWFLMKYNPYKTKNINKDKTRST